MKSCDIRCEGFETRILMQNGIHSCIRPGQRKKRK